MEIENKDETVARIVDGSGLVDALEPFLKVETFAGVEEIRSTETDPTDVFCHLKNFTITLFSKLSSSS